MSTDVVDEWLAIQDEAPGLEAEKSPAAGAPVRAPRPRRNLPDDADELHLFMGDDEPSASGIDVAKTPPTGEEWPVDVLLADEWSVSRLVH